MNIPSLAVANNGAQTLARLVVVVHLILVLVAVSAQSASAQDWLYMERMIETDPMTDEVTVIMEQQVRTSFEIYQPHRGTVGLHISCSGEGTPILEIMLNNRPEKPPLLHLRKGSPFQVRWRFNGGPVSEWQDWVMTDEEIGYTDYVSAEKPLEETGAVSVETFVSTSKLALEIRNPRRDLSATMGDEWSYLDRGATGIPKLDCVGGGSTAKGKRN